MQAWGGSLKCDTNKNIAEVAVPLDSWRLAGYRWALLTGKIR